MSLETRGSALDRALARDILEALTESYLVADPDGLVVAVNHGARTLLAPTEPPPFPLADVVADEDRAHVGELLERWAATGSARPGALSTRTGLRLCLNGRRLGAHPLLLVGAQEVTSAMPGFVGLTDSRREDNLRVRTRQLDQAVAELHEANQRLEEANTELGQHVHAVAHDIRTPLFTLQGAARRLRSGGSVDPDGAPYLDLVLSSARRLHAVTEALLAAARVDQRHWTVERLPTRAVVDAVLEQLGPLLAEAEASVRVGDLPDVVTDRVAFHQVLFELLANAVSHRSTQRPLRIDVEATRTDQVVELSVADTGAGIRASEAARLFELFQGGVRDADAPGRGIGLAICRKLVTRWGGTIRCQPRRSVGTRFVFTVPAATVAAPPGST